MKLSIVTTLYNSQVFLDKFIIEIQNSCKQLDISDYQIVFVNDGSPDNSFDIIREKQKTINNIVLIDLSRNFGHHYALQAGMQYAVENSEYIFLIDNDLETPPSFLVDCFRKMRENNEIDVVYGVQGKRKGKAIERIGGSLFWKFINLLSDVKIPKNLLTERLMKQQYVKNLLKLGDTNLFLGGMMAWTGFNQIELEVKKGIRDGRSTYSVTKRIDLMIQAITSFSGKPLMYLFNLGLFITLFSFISLLVLVFIKLGTDSNIQIGWTSIIAVNFMALGLLSTFLGLIGIYLFKIFRQVQGRPNSIIKKVYEQ